MRLDSDPRPRFVRAKKESGISNGRYRAWHSPDKGRFGEKLMQEIL